MIKLNGSTHTLQAVMSGAAATTNPDYWSSWNQLTNAALDLSSGSGGTLNGATPVTLAAGVSAKQIQVTGFSIFNRDTAAVTITIQMDVSGTARKIYSCVLQVGESLNFDGSNFTVSNTSGYFLSAVGAAGSTTQVQYNKNGSMTGNAGLTFDDTTQTLSQLGTNPSDVMKASTANVSAPSAGNLAMNVKKLCGREMQQTRSALGAVRWAEVAEANGFHATALAGAGGNVLTYNGFNVAVGGTAGTALPALTNLYTCMTRITWASVVTTQNQQIGVHGANASYFRGNIAGGGGFFFVCRFGFESIKTGMRCAVGMGVSSANIVDTDPSGRINCAFFGFDVGDTAWTFMHNDGSGTATKDTIGGQATLATNNTGFDAYVFCYPNDSVIYYRLDDIVQGTTLCDTSTNTDLPVNTVGLAPIIMMSNGTANTTAGDAKIAINQFATYTER